MVEKLEILFAQALDGGVQQINPAVPKPFHIPRKPQEIARLDVFCRIVNRSFTIHDE
jgi:hypothetical protein